MVQWSNGSMVQWTTDHETGISRMPPDVTDGGQVESIMS
jgi:hypothetical protein